MNTRNVLLTALIILLSVSVFGQSDDSIQTDNLFGDDSSALVEETPEDTEENDLTTELLTSDTGVVLGGRYHFSASASVVEDNLVNPSMDSLDDSFSLDLGTTLSFDARPDDSIRVLGKVAVSYPFIYDTSRNFSDVFHVTELFSDFNIDNKVFFRAGKSTVNWGVGYFFSPADLLNLSKVDPEDPDAELEGPVSVKMNLPFGLNNLYLYIIAPEGITSASELAAAPMAEFVFGITELGVGAYYQKDHSPAAMATLTSAAGDFSLFAEGVVTYGSDKTFVQDDYSLLTYDDKLFYKTTIGTMYTWSDDLSNFKVSFTGQYLFNGEGYAYDDQDFVTANRQIVIAGIMSGSGVFSALSLSDIAETGRHYGAASLMWSSMLQSDFSLSVFYLGNFSDGSGMIKPTLSFSGLDDIDISLGLSYLYGEAGDEYTPFGDSVSASLTISLGGTAF